MPETPLTDLALDWAEDVLLAQVPANRRIVQACQRFKEDLARAGTVAFPYVFDKVASEHLCAFLERCPHIEGEWAARGETLKLSAWQAFTMAQLNGWRHMTTGLRRFRYVYLEVPRKNGKSTLLGGLGLYFLTVDGEAGAKVFSAASSTDQARIVFDTARNMAATGSFQGEPFSSALGLHVEEHKIKTADPAAVFRPIAAQTKTQDGKNPHCALVDELHEHQKRDVWDALTSALGARQQPVLIAITTAGHNTAGICYEQRRYVQRLLDGVQTDESYLGMIFEADEGDDPGDPTTWAKANPNLGISKSVEYLHDEWRKASASPAAMGEFLRKHLNVWTSVGASALDMDRWRASANPMLRLADQGGLVAWLGVDLAVRHDFASVALVVDAVDELRCFSWHFLPEDTVRKPGNEHYLGWLYDGWLQATPGAMLDLNIVQDLVLRLAGLEVESGWTYRGLDDGADLGIEQVVVDPTFAAQMASNWEAEGLLVNMMASRARNMNEPFQRLIGAVEDGRFVTEGNPVLEWMASNTIMRQVQGGDMIYPAKLNPEDKIDGIVAVINALWPLGQVAEQALTPEPMIRFA